jgi:hypothetical protein
MLAFVVTALLAQAPSSGVRGIAVILSGRSGMPEARALQLAQTVSDNLAHAGVPVTLGPRKAVEALATMGFPSASECQGRRPCVASQGLLLRVWGVIGVEVADLDGTTAIHVELVGSNVGDRLTDVDLMLPSKAGAAELNKQFAPSVPAFVRALEGAQRPNGTAAAPPAHPPAAANPPPSPPKSEPPPATAAAKPAPASATSTADAPLETLDEPAPSFHAPKHWPSIACFAVAGASAVTSAVMVGLATDTKGRIDAARTQVGGQPALAFNQRDALLLTSRANSEYTAALVTVLSAAAFAALGVVLLLLGDST